MTCEDFRKAIRQKANDIGTAMFAAMMVHHRSCKACREDSQQLTEEFYTTATPADVLRVEMASKDKMRKVRADPEAREVLDTFTRTKEKIAQAVEAMTFFLGPDAPPCGCAHTEHALDCQLGQLRMESVLATLQWVQGKHEAMEWFIEQSIELMDQEKGKKK